MEVLHTEEQNESVSEIALRWSSGHDLNATSGVLSEVESGSQATESVQVRAADSKLVAGKSSRFRRATTMPPLPTPVVRRPRRVVTRQEWAFLKVRKFFMGITGISMMAFGTLFVGLMVLVGWVASAVMLVMGIIQLIIQVISLVIRSPESDPAILIFACLQIVGAAVLFCGVLMGANAVKSLMEAGWHKIEGADELDRHVVLSSQAVAAMPASDSLVRASEIPVGSSAGVLLRPALAGSEIPAEELVRPAGAPETAGASGATQQEQS